MKKICVVGLLVMTIATAGVLAGDTPGNAVKKDRNAENELVVRDMTITGTVKKTEKMKKDGTPMMTWFRLVDENGSEVRVPKGKIEEFVGCKVKVTGQGYTIENKNKSMRAFKTITNIEKLEGATAPVPLAQ